MRNARLPFLLALLSVMDTPPSFDALSFEPVNVRRGASPRTSNEPPRGYPGLPGKKANPKREQQKAAKRARKKAKRGW